MLYRHVHAECDDAIDNLMLDRVRNEEQVDYMCSVCRNRDPEVGSKVLVVGNRHLYLLCGTRLYFFIYRFTVGHSVSSFQFLP